MAFSVFFFPHLALTSRLENMMQSPHLQFFGAIIRTKFQFFPETRVDLFSQFLGEDPALTHQIQNPPRIFFGHNFVGDSPQATTYWWFPFFSGVLWLEVFAPCHNGLHITPSYIGLAAKTGRHGTRRMSVKTLKSLFVQWVSTLEL